MADTGSNRDVFVVEYGISVTSGRHEIEDRTAESLDVDSGWDLDPNIYFPLGSLNEIADGKWCLSVVVGSVMSKDHVSPSLVEVSGGHDEKRDRFQLTPGRFMLSYVPVDSEIVIESAWMSFPTANTYGSEGWKLDPTDNSI